jgi:alpha-beta hydrolase superfamily lysophospholipase
MKHFTIALCITFLAVTGRAHSDERIVKVETGTGKLEGTLLTPDKNTRPHVALIIAGSGPTDRNGNNPQMTNNSLKMLAESLAKQGISSLRYDKRGIGKSKDAGLKESDLRFEHYIEDVRHWIDYLAHDQKNNTITLIGHSEGSLLGMIAAQSSDVGKFVSIAGIGQAADKIIRQQLKAQPSIVLEQSTPILDALLAGNTVKHIPAFLNSLFRQSVQPYMISWFKYDPQKEIAKLQRPILIVQGTTDIQVSEEEASKLALASKTTTKVVIKGMNHVLKAAPLDRQANIETYNQPNLPLKPELAKAISEFIIN